MITFITTFFNEESSIINFLESLFGQSIQADEYILLDGGSTDNTVSLVNQLISQNKEKNIKLVIDDKCNLVHTRGPVAKGRNVAISLSKNEIIAVSDAGCVLDKYWLFNITKPIIEGVADISSGRSSFTQNTSNYMSTDQIIHNDYKNPSSRNIAFNKRAWAAVGGYPENYLTGEDTFFNYKLRSKNFKFHFSSNAIVYWDAPRNKAELIKKQIGYGKGDGFNRLYFKNFLLRFLLLFFPIYYLNKKSFKKSYISAISYQKGYIKGLLEYYFKK